MFSCLFVLAATFCLFVCLFVFFWGGGEGEHVIEVPAADDKKAQC